jgi:uroporphyrinogen III methyltransferase/synthase
VSAGRVYLVGAGPGDPRLITLRGAEVLQNADVVVHDRLVSPALLGLAPLRAERVDAGKESRGGALQEEINATLIDRALLGKRVVRLRAATRSCWTGRRGQVLADRDRLRGRPRRDGRRRRERLRRHPERSAAWRAVAFVTGHEDPGKEGEAIDWAALAAFERSSSVGIAARRASPAR